MNSFDWHMISNRSPISINSLPVKTMGSVMITVLSVRETEYVLEMIAVLSILNVTQGIQHPLFLVRIAPGWFDGAELFINRQLRISRDPE